MTANTLKNDHGQVGNGLEHSDDVLKERRIEEEKNIVPCNLLPSISMQKSNDAENVSLEQLYESAQVFERQQNWSALLRTIEQIVGNADGQLEPVVILNMYKYSARICEQQLEQPLLAELRWKQVLELAPDDSEALAWLENRFRDSANWSELAGVLTKVWTEKRRDDYEDKGYELACILNDIFFQHEHAKQILSTLFGSKSTTGPVCDKLIDICQIVKDWELLVSLVSFKLHYTSNSSERALLCLHASQVADSNLNQPQRALRLLLNELENVAQLSEAMDEIFRLGKYTNSLHSVFQNTIDAFYSSTDTATKGQLAAYLGDWYTECGDNIQIAATWYVNSLQWMSHNFQSLIGLKNIYLLGRQWDALVGTLQHMIKLSTDSIDKKAFLIELGDHFLYNTEDWEKAVEAYMNAYILEPDDELCLHIKNIVYSKEIGYWAYVRVLEHKVSQCDDVDQTIIALREIGELQENVLHDFGAATSAYKHIVRLDREDATALDGLIRIYRSGDQWKSLATCLEQRIQLMGAKHKDRITLIEELGPILRDKLDSESRALSYFMVGLELNPDNIAVYDAIYTIQYKNENWDKLAECTLIHADALSDIKRKVAMYFRASAIFTTKLNLYSESAKALERALACKFDETATLERLVVVYRYLKEWKLVYRTLGDLCGFTQDPLAKATLLYQMSETATEGKLSQKMVAQPLEDALSMVPGHTPSLWKLAEYYRSLHHWDASFHIYSQLLEYLTEHNERSVVMYRVSQLCANMPSYEYQSISWVERAAKEDGCNEGAVAHLVEWLFSEGKKKEALAWVENFIFNTVELPQRSLSIWYHRHGVIQTSLNCHVEAQRSFMKAIQLDSANYESHQMLAESLFENDSWKDAAIAFETLISCKHFELTQNEVFGYRFKAAVCTSRIGSYDEALGKLRSLLEEQHRNQDVIRELITVCGLVERYDLVLEHQSTLVDLISDRHEQFQLFESMGDIYSEKYKQWRKSANAYEKALSIKPRHRSMLHKTLSVYQRLSDWSGARSVLIRLIAGESESPIKSKLCLALALICRDKERNLEDARIWFSRAVKYDPGNVKALDSIETLLADSSDYESLESLYVGLLNQRVVCASPSSECLILRKLGDLYTHHLIRPREAIKAIRRASKLEPSNELFHKKLAKLYIQMPNQKANAERELDWLVKSEPTDLSRVSMLRRFYIDNGDSQKAFYLSQVLKYKGVATEEDIELLNQNDQDVAVLPTVGLSRKLWASNIVNDVHLMEVGKLASFLAPKVLCAAPYTPKWRELKTIDSKRDEWYLQTHDLFGKLACCLAVRDVPSLSIKPRLKNPIEHINTYPLSSAIGSDFGKEVTAKEQFFIIGHHLSYYHREHQLRCIVPSIQELTALLWAAISLVTRDVILPAGMDALRLGRYSELLDSQLNEFDRERLKSIVDAMMKNNNPVDVQQWQVQLDYAADRAGLTLCGDLDASIAVIQQHHTLLTLNTTQNRIDMLLKFAVSAEYLALRKRFSRDYKQGSDAVNVYQSNIFEAVLDTGYGILIPSF